MNPELRKDIRESRELVRELRQVLRPEPLPERLRRQISAELDARTKRGSAAWILRPIRLVGLAAAAAILALLVFDPPKQPVAQIKTAQAVTLSEQDAADIVATYGLLAWSGHLDYSIEQVAGEVQKLEQRIEKRSDMPWSAEDDWDRPRAAGQGALLNPLPGANDRFGARDDDGEDSLA